MATALAAAALPAAVGCAPRVWVESQQRIELSAADIDTLAAVTHNGRVTVVATDNADSDLIVVEAAKRAGARTEEEAQACMDALTITTDVADRTQKLGWKLDRPKPPSWQVQVAFEVTVPPRLAVDAKSHNGRIEVRGVKGDCRVETHNGAISVQSTGRIVEAETHNGKINVRAAASQVALLTHNGSIDARLQADGDLGGSVTTHNGQIHLRLGDRTATRLACSTYNGRIHCRRELDDATINRRHLRGRVGDADAELTAQTHNGSITIE
ncbi:MAG: DUF4097 domain-containing protein [bacterium]|nr:DUF4097 domain-containing protein [bacterium]